MIIPFAKKVALVTTMMGAAIGAHAATATANFAVKITVTESCTLTSTAPASDVDFGSSPRTTAAVTLSASGNLTVNCSSGTPYILGLNGGANYLGSTGTVADPAPNNRRMKSAAGNYVSYDLYRDAASTFWGNNGTLAATGNTYSASGSGADQTIVVRGKVIALNVPAGSYSDTVTATITY